MFNAALGAESNVEVALNSDAETTRLEFKSSFSIDRKGEFLEIIKDIVAMANSGGGVILFGLRSDGTLNGTGMDGVEIADPAKITDAIYKYTDCQFQDFELRKASKSTHEVWALIIGPASAPIVFSQTGNYLDSSGKQKNAFLGGSVYFRHGAKSEVGNSEDLRLFIEGQLECVRHEWLDGIAKVVEAPSGSVIQVLSPHAAERSSPVKLTTNAAAHDLPVGAIDAGWPYRMKEVVAEVNRILAGIRTINSTHILNVRRAYDVEEKGEFCYTQKHVAPKIQQSLG
jgi:hypothetical protein